MYIPGCSYEQMSHRVSMPIIERNLTLLEKVNEILTAEGTSSLIGSVQLGGSDATDVTDAGIPRLDSLGAVGSGAHTENETAKIASLAEAAKEVAAIIYHI